MPSVLYLNARFVQTKAGVCVFFRLSNPYNVHNSETFNEIVSNTSVCQSHFNNVARRADPTLLLTSITDEWQTTLREKMKHISYAISRFSLPKTQEKLKGTEGNYSADVNLF